MKKIIKKQEEQFYYDDETIERDIKYFFLKEIQQARKKIADDIIKIIDKELKTKELLDWQEIKGFIKNKYKD